MGKTKRIKKEQKLAQNTANGAANQDGEPELGDNRSDKPVIGHLIGQAMQEENQGAHKVLQTKEGIVMILEQGHCYRLTNLKNEDALITVVDGLYVNNGKKLPSSQTASIKSTIYLSIATTKQQHKRERSQLASTIAMHLNCGVNQEIVEMLRDYDHNEHALVVSGCAQGGLKVEESQVPWLKLDIAPFVRTNQTTLLVGPKNTGKSTLCEYVLNLTQDAEQGEQIREDVCVLDLDVGRNRTYPGCISLTVVKNRKVIRQTSIWVGEYTVLNNSATYLKALRVLYQLYQREHFGSALLINTMGYLTGLGELLIYEIYNIVRPHRVLLMEASDTNTVVGDEGEQQQHINLTQIRYNIEKNKYIDRLYFSKQMQDQYYSTSAMGVGAKFVTHVNPFAEQKAAALRFEYLLSPTSGLKSIEELILLILRRGLKKISSSNFNLLQQNRMGDVCELDRSLEGSAADMRVVALCRNVEGGIFQMVGVGFGWDSAIYYDPKVVDLGEEPVLAVLSEGVDMERSFYQIKQSKVIWLEDKIGGRIPYLSPVLKVLGSKGVRNNPGKRINQA